MALMLYEARFKVLKPGLEKELTKIVEDAVREVGGRPVRSEVESRDGIVIVRTLFEASPIAITTLIAIIAASAAALGSAYFLGGSLSKAAEAAEKAMEEAPGAVKAWSLAALLAAAALLISALRRR